MKFGCHAVLFADRIRTEPLSLLQELKETGFSGVEFGARFVPLEDRTAVMEAFQKTGLEIAAIHYMSLDWLSDPEKAIAGAVEEAKFLSAAGGKNLTMSFMAKPEDDLTVMAKNINQAAKAVKEYGVFLNYHNHNWEFQQNGACYRALCQYAPDLYFGFDLGWVRKGGFDPVAVLRENAGRVRYVHLRDPGDDLESRTFPDLGEGKTDLKGQLAVLKEILPEDGWVVVEYETGEPDAKRYQKAKRYLDTLLTK